MPQTQDQTEVESAVRAHAGWVYSCARRRVRDDALAEDVTQAVFILFWQKRVTVWADARVTGWLYRAVRYCAGNALRLKQIRQRHEREAAMAALADGSAGEAEWSQVSPELEWAVDRLRDEDRSAVLLRFYRQMSFAEVGESLGISEEAAKKRVQRAVEKLRGVLAKKGVMAGAGALGVVMAEKVTEAAPAGLVEAATGAAGGGGTGSAGVIAKGAMKMMAWAKVKAAAGLAIIAVLAAVATLEVRAQTNPAHETTGAPVPSAAATNPAAPGDVEAQRLLTSAQAASAWTERAASTVRLKMRTGYTAPPLAIRVDQSARYVHAPDGQSHLKVDVLSAERNGKISVAPRYEHILTDKEHIRCVLSAAGAPPFPPMVQLDQEPGLVERWRKLDLADDAAGGFLNGMVGSVDGGPASVIELLRKGSPRLVAGAAVVDGVECSLVESETAAGMVRIWVAPSRGFNIAKFTVDRPSVAGRDSLSYQLVFDQAKFAEVGGRTVVVGGRFQEKHGETKSGRDGATWERDETAERSEIDLNPRFDEPGLFRISGVPDGTPVEIIAQRENHDYVWMGGRPVKKYNP